MSAFSIDLEDVAGDNVYISFTMLIRKEGTEVKRTQIKINRMPMPELESWIVNQARTYLKELEDAARAIPIDEYAIHLKKHYEAEI